MSLRTHFFYWVLPGVVVGALIGLHFANVPMINMILAPEFNRELGLIESIQHIELVIVMVIAYQGMKRAPERLPKLGFAVILGVSLFLFLEEINYGQHYWNSLQGIPKKDGGGALSIHNIGGNTERFKLAGDIVVAGFFVLLPLLAWNRGPAWFRFFVPPRGLITTVIVAFLLSKIAHHLNDIGMGQARLGNSIAEFREILSYYLGLLYVYELALRRKWPGFQSVRTASG